MHELRHIPASWLLNARIKSKNKTCSVKDYGTPCTTMHNLRAREKRRQTLRSLFTLSRAHESRLTCTLFQTTDFPYPVGKLNNTDLPLQHAGLVRIFFFRGIEQTNLKMSHFLNCSMEHALTFWELEWHETWATKILVDGNYFFLIYAKLFPYTISYSESQTSLLRFLKLRDGRGVCTQATRNWPIKTDKLMLLYR